MITIERSAPLLTIQDAGRPGYLAAGVTRSGPLDARSLAIANALCGNASDAAALEGCLGGALIRCDAALTFALTGADLVASIGGSAIAANQTVNARAGDLITIERITRGAIWYMAVRGGLDVPRVLGSRSTLLPAGIGGLGGRQLRNGDVLNTGAQGGIHSVRVAPPSLLTSLVHDALPLVEAPRSDALGTEGWQVLTTQTFRVSRAMSRVGYRLEGPPIVSTLAADLASEPACGGAMQLPPEGQPIVLMADHPTIGGYPIIGVVPEYALGMLAQRAPGDEVRFVRTSLTDAIATRRQHKHALSQWLIDL